MDRHPDSRLHLCQHGGRQPDPLLRGHTARFEQVRAAPPELIRTQHAAEHQLLVQPVQVPGQPKKTSGNRKHNTQPRRRDTCITDEGRQHRRREALQGRTDPLSAASPLGPPAHQVPGASPETRVAAAAPGCPQPVHTRRQRYSKTCWKASLHLYLEIRLSGPWHSAVLAAASLTASTSSTDFNSNTKGRPRVTIRRKGFPLARC